jgi:hypothetical protein
MPMEKQSEPPKEHEDAKERPPSRPKPTLPNPFVGIKTGKPAPELRDR